jgi:Ca-activated chloride channel family protein
VVILLTDGANTSGSVDPLKAADLAAREGVRIYTIGVGADEMLVRGFFGTHGQSLRGSSMKTRFKAIAERTGGQYFPGPRYQRSRRIYQKLDELEPVQSDQESVRPVDELFFWPLSAAFLMVLSAVLWLLWPRARLKVGMA